MQRMDELNLDLQRKQRLLQNLKKNYDRRKKLNLIDNVYESQIKEDIKNLENEISTINRTIRSIESQEIRSKYINKN